MNKKIIAAIWIAILFFVAAILAFCKVNTPEGVYVIKNVKWFPAWINAFVKSDSNKNVIKTYLPNSYNKDDLTIVEWIEVKGIDFKKAEWLQIITHGFIQITYPPEINKPQTIAVKPSKKVNIVFVYDSKNGFMKKTPFMVNDDNEIVFKVEPVNGKIIFSLIDEIEE